MKDAALSTVARVLVILCQLIYIKLYTNYLSVEQIGIFFFLLAISYSANALLFVPVDYYQQAKLREVITNSGGIRPILTFNRKLASLYSVFSLLLVIACGTIDIGYALYALLAASLAIALYSVQALRNTLNNLENRRVVSISFIQEAVLKILIIYLLFLYIDATESLMVFAWIVALAFSGVYLFYCAKKSHLFISTSDFQLNTKEIIEFSYPFSIGAVCNWLQLQGYRVILVPLGFAEEVGIFATISSIGAAAIGAVSLIYSQQFTPIIYKSSGRSTPRYLVGAILVIISVALAALALGEFVVKMLTSTRFESYWELLLFGVITDGGNLIIGALIIYFTLTNNTKKIISISSIGLLSAIICFAMLYFTASISLLTIGIPLLISQWIVVFTMYKVYRNHSTASH